MERVMTDREVHGHETNVANRMLTIFADAPGSGNASHVYRTIYNVRGHEGGVEGEEQEIRFQNGPIQEVGVNGVTNESLLSIVRHRLQGFQSGPYACRENALALTKIEEALHWLHHRTRERDARGVEGTNKV